MVNRQPKQLNDLWYAMTSSAKRQIHWEMAARRGLKLSWYSSTSVVTSCVSYERPAQFDMARSATKRAPSVTRTGHHQTCAHAARGQSVVAASVAAIYPRRAGPPGQVLLPVNPSWTQLIDFTSARTNYTTRAMYDVHTSLLTFFFLKLT
jgi:hypothetical protein